MIKKLLVLVALLSLAVTFTGSVPGVTRASTAAEPTPLVPASLAGNLLANGYMNGGFYWRPTNHFVADMWYEWWLQGEIPEFIDGGHPYHNQCYPEPQAGGLCADEGNRSQGYIRMGPAVVAGVYQPVKVTACATYRFEAYNRNDDNISRPKVGIEPTGWQNPKMHPGDINNCPPDGATACPDPSLDSVPATIVWSPEFPHAAYTWVSQSVTAEALTDTLTVFTYVATPPGSISAYWDYASLVQVSSNNLLEPSDTLPTPDGRISSVAVTPAYTTARITWDAGQPARSQVYYRAHPTPTVPISATSQVFLPIIASVNSTVGGYWPGTPTLTLDRNQSVTLYGLQPGTAYDFFVVSRWVNGSSCTSSISATDTFTTTAP